MKEIEKLIAEGIQVIDVRTPMEFMAASAPGSINIPLNEIPNRVEELKERQQPLVLCCQSGNRSGQACAYLGAQGIECLNAGSWLNVNHMLANIS